MRLFAGLGLLLAVLLVAVSIGVQAAEGQCAAQHAQWTEAYELLRQAVDALRDAKEQSIESRISQTLANETRLTIAQKIQMVLKERSRNISEITRKAVEAADQEKWAFDQLRRCGGSDSARRSGAINSAVTGPVRERNKLLTDLQELLLDEAYAQYRRESPNPAPAYSGYGQDQQSAQYHNRQFDPRQRMGYEAYGPGYGYQ